MGFSATVPKFGQVVDLNFSRAYVARAATALDRGELITAACLLRHGVLLQLRAEVQWHGCEPPKFSRKTPARELLRAMQKAGHCDQLTFELVEEILTNCHKAAHCERVRPKVLYDCILLAFNLIDNTPCNRPANMIGLPAKSDGFPQPVDDDDDDSADWWKAVNV